jgi:hypothetical protein
MGGSCILHLGVGVIKMMEDVLDQSISDDTGEQCTNPSDLPAACRWRQGRLATIFLLDRELVGLRRIGSG